MSILKNISLDNMSFKISKSQLYKYGELLFFSSVILAFIDYILFDCTNFSKIIPNVFGNILTIIIYLLLLLKIITFSYYTSKEIKIIFLLTGIVILSLLCSKNFLILKLFLFIIGNKNISTKKLFNLVRKLIVFSLVITICCSFLNIIESHNILRDNSSFIRYSLGFNHPNMLSMFILQFILISLFLDYEKFNVKYMIFYLIIIFVTYFITDSRTTCMLGLGCYCIFLFIYFLKLDTGSYLDSNSNFIKESTTGKNDFIKNNLVQKTVIKKSFLFFKKIFIFFPEFLGFGSLFLGKYYNVTLSQLNNLFSGRLMYINVFLNMYGIHLFGTYVPYGSSYINSKGELVPLILDNAYANITIRFGLIILILLLIAYSLLTKKLISQKQIISLLIVSVYLVFGLMESHFIYITANFSLFFLSQVLYESNTPSNNEKIFSLLLKI